MDVNGGALTQPNGSPVGPGTTVTGPLLAGGVFHSDGTGNLAGLGGSAGQANVGYAVMAQSATVTQAALATASAVPAIVIPAQSQILGMQAMVTTAFTGNVTTFGVGTTGNATFFTSAAAAEGNTTGLITAGFAPTAGNATMIGNWDNVGSSDVELAVKPANTGSGVMTFTVRYLQGINNAS